MSVIIPIGVSAAGVLGALDQVREALRQTGQEGRALRDLDLSHPELTAFAGDLGRMRQQMEDLLLVGRGATASNARAMNHQGAFNPLGSQADQDAAWSRVFPDAAERERAQRRANAYVTAGTQFAPGALPPGPPQYGPPAPIAPQYGPPAPGVQYGPPLPPPPSYDLPADPNRGRPRLSEDEEQLAGGKNFAKTALGLVKGPVGFLLGAAGVTGLANMAGTAVSAATQESAGNDQLMRRMPDMATDFDHLRDTMRQAADGMGLTYRQAIELGITFQKLGNNTNRYVSAQDQLGYTSSMVRLSAGLARSFGSDAGTMAGALSKADAAGIGGREFAGMIADATAQGGMSGKVEVVMDAVMAFTSTANRFLPKGDMPGMAAQYLSMFTGMNASLATGLHGANGAAVINQLDQSVRSGGGGGMASTALNYRAFARNGVTDPYDMLYRQEEGMFGLLPSGQTNYEAQKAEIDRQYQGRPRLERLHALNRHNGLSMHVNEALDGLKPGEIGRTQKHLQDLGISSDGIAPDAFADIAKVLSGGDLDAERKKILGRSDVTGPEKDRITAASGEGLRDELVKALAAHGMEKTEATRYGDATAAMANGLTKLGEYLIAPLTAIKEGTARGADAAEIVARFFTTAGQGPGLAAPPRADAAGVPLPGTTANPNAFPDPGNGYGAGFGGATALPITYRMVAPGGRGGGVGGDTGGGGLSAALPEGVAASRSQQAYDYFRTQGWTAEQAAGITMGNFAESGMRTDADGDSHRSGGIGQWNGTRRAEFARQYGHDVRQGTLGEQLAFEQWELTHTEKAAGDRIRAEHTAYGAGAAHSRWYERPRDVGGNMGRRGSSSEQALPGLRAHEGSSGASGADPGGRVVHIMAPLRNGGDGDGHMQHSITPLRVVHEDARGNVLRTETLPVQAVPQPQPYGRAYAT